MERECNRGIERERDGERECDRGIDGWRERVC